jgi:tetratricopeptide (TPR) repeat protein
MKNAANLTRRIILLVVCHVAALAQHTELAPLLPEASPATLQIRRAVLDGDLPRAAALATGLAEADRVLWRGILAIVRNEPIEAIRILPRNGQPKVLGVAYYLARQQILFRQQMAEAIRILPGDFGAYYYLGRHYDSDVDDAQEAAKWFRLALARNAQFLPARYYLGYCLERMGRDRDAEVEYRASLALAQSLAGMARLRLGANDYPEALRYVKSSLQLDPRDASVAKLAARVYSALDRPADAILALELASRLAPRDATIRYQLWRAYKAKGELEKSAAALREFERLRAIYGLNQ